MSIRPLHRRLLPGLVALTLLLPNAAWAGPQPPGPSVGAGNSVAIGEGPFVRACGANANGTVTSSSGSYQDIQSCTMTIAQNGKVLVLASASLGLDLSTDHYEAALRLDHNTGFTGDPATERTVDLYPDSALLASGDGTDRNVALTAVYAVTPGVHTFTLLWKRNEYSNVNVKMEAIDASISAVFVPDGLDVQLCGQKPGGSWTTTDLDSHPSVHCTLTANRPGVVLVSADGWVKLDVPSNPPYEAGTRLVMDDYANSGGARYTDVYTSTALGGTTLSGDGIDTTAANTWVFPVTAGTHTFTYTYNVQYGAGPVRMVNASLAALFVPDDSPYAQACYALGGSDIQHDSTSFTTVESCSLSAPSESWVLMSASTSVGLASSSYEGLFSLGIDDQSPEGPTSRYVNSYPDYHDGTDGPYVDALIEPISAGPHTFNFIARRFAGTGKLRMWYPALFVLVPGASTYVPVSWGP